MCPFKRRWKPPRTLIVWSKFESRCQSIVGWLRLEMEVDSHNLTSVWQQKTPFLLTGAASRREVGLFCLCIKRREEGCAPPVSWESWPSDRRVFKRPLFWITSRMAIKMGKAVIIHAVTHGRSTDSGARCFIYSLACLTVTLHRVPENEHNFFKFHRWSNSRQSSSLVQNLKLEKGCWMFTFLSKYTVTCFLAILASKTAFPM